jgi:hypothetical protein
MAFYFSAQYVKNEQFLKRSILPLRILIFKTKCLLSCEIDSFITEFVKCISKHVFGAQRDIIFLMENKFSFQGISAFWAWANYEQSDDKTQKRSNYQNEFDFWSKIQVMYKIILIFYYCRL